MTNGAERLYWDGSPDHPVHTEYDKFDYAVDLAQSYGRDLPWLVRQYQDMTFNPILDFSWTREDQDDVDHFSRLEPPTDSDWLGRPEL